MTAANERAAIGGILSAWTTTQICYPNDKFTPPPKASWVRLVIQAGDSAQIELGGEKNTHRHPGLVILQVFTPLEWGDKTALDYADQLAALFRRKTVSFTGGSIVFRSPTVREVGPDAAYFQVNVSVPFVRDVLF
jgi:hypothetical protein